MSVFRKPSRGPYASVGIAALVILKYTFRAVIYTKGLVEEFSMEVNLQSRPDNLRLAGRGSGTKRGER